MKNLSVCICGQKANKSGLCEECIKLLRAKKSKNLSVLEKFRKDYNESHTTYKSYGQFVLLLEMISRRKREVDNRGKKAVIKKVQRDRRTNRTIA